MTLLSRVPVAGVLLFAALAPAQGPKGGPPKGPPAPPAADLERFRALDPAERLRVARQAAGPKAAFAAVTRGDLAVTVVERGSLEPTRVADLACRLKARDRDRPAATIRWLIDEGTAVKKGDKLAELDDADVRERYQVARVRVAEADAALAAATEGVRLARKEGEIEVRLAQIEVALAEAELKDAPAGQAKRGLELKAERAKLLLERAKTRAQAGTARAEADLKARTAARELEADRLGALEVELGHCVLAAPMDGLAVYPAPAGRFGGGAIRVGEGVREGQVVIRVVDPSQVAAVTRVHEAHVSRVREGQPATVRVDAFPERVVGGKVAKVATVASQADWMASDVKVYPVTVALEKPPAGLKPGMSAEVHIVTAEKTGVLRVPVQAVLGSGRDRFCFVKVGEELQERTVTTGASSPMAVEVTDGLKEGEEVLADPRAALPRLAPGGRKGGEPPQAKGAGAGGTLVVARSVRPPDDGSAGRSFVQSYGLTPADLGRFAGLPAVAEAAPLRVFPTTAARLARSEPVVLVATTPALTAVHRSEPAAGRQLTADDDRQMSNVAVLGKAAAAALFGDAEAIGQTVTVGGQPFQVVGVLGDQPAFPGGVLPDPDRAVYVPLRTSHARFGDRVVIRSGATRRVEAVPLHAVLLRVRAAADAGPTAEAVRAILTADHAQKDWQVDGPAGP